jgi:hypothetical protein
MKCRQSPVIDVFHSGNYTVEEKNISTNKIKG